MRMVTIFEARHGTIAYSSSAITWDASTEASDESFTANVSELKNVTMEFPEMSVEQVPLLGNTQVTIGANTVSSGSALGPVTGTFQNAMLDMKNATNYKFSGTVVFTGDEEFFHVLGLDSGVAIGGVAKRYSIGNLTTAGADARTLNGALRLFLNNGSEEANAVMTNTVVTKIGPLKTTGADGHWECDVEMECLPRDGFLEFLD